MKSPSMEPWRVSYRVDLQEAEWCSDKCTTVTFPALAKPNVLVLVETNMAGERISTVFVAPDGHFMQLSGYGTSILLACPRRVIRV